MTMRVTSATHAVGSDKRGTMDSIGPDFLSTEGYYSTVITQIMGNL
jgi:hypothetical protein